MKNKLIKTLKQKTIRLRHRYLDNFIFIHINKTGGSSIEKVLNIHFEHKTALYKIEKLGREVWDKRITFTVVRNPWDKVVSQYHYDSGIRRHKIMKRPHSVDTKRAPLINKPVEFNEWVQLTYGRQDPTYYVRPKFFAPQIDWISDKQGNILVKDILFFENLNEDFKKLADKIGRNISLPHVNKSSRGEYRKYYTDETSIIIQKWFKRDIEVFNYKF